jgi:ABC-2 type transport system ATP-binding protein
MDEAQYLADRVAVIARGSIVAEGPPSTLAGRDRMLARITFRVGDDVQVPDLGQVELPDGVLEIAVNEPTQALHRLTGWALDHGVVLEGLEVTRPSLEDVYLEITGTQEETE